METCFNYCYKPGEKYDAYFASDEPKWIRYIHRLKEAHPDEVTILNEPETNDGCIYCKVPASILKLKFPKNISEEHRQRLDPNFTRNANA